MNLFFLFKIALHCEVVQKNKIKNPFPAKPGEVNKEFKCVFIIKIGLSVLGDFNA